MRTHKHTHIHTYMYTRMSLILCQMQDKYMLTSVNCEKDKETIHVEVDISGGSVLCIQCTQICYIMVIALCWLSVHCVASVLLLSHTHRPITLLPVLQAYTGYEALASFGRVVELERHR